jgi:hypothetical protein
VSTLPNKFLDELKKISPKEREKIDIALNEMQEVQNSTTTLQKTYADKEVISTSILRVRSARLQSGLEAFVVKGRRDRYGQNQRRAAFYYPPVIRPALFRTTDYLCKSMELSSKPVYFLIVSVERPSGMGVLRAVPQICLPSWLPLCRFQQCTVQAI